MPGKGDTWLRVLLPATASAYLDMVDPDARLALRLTFKDIAEYLNSPSSGRFRGEAAELVRACIPVLDGLNFPYTPTPSGDSTRHVEHFTLRVDVAPETDAAVPAALVLGLTDMTDYLAHLSRGGHVNYGMENYISAQCQGFLDELDAFQTPDDQLP